MADLLMGVYLCLLIAMDLYTDGSFYLIIAQWTNSPLCIVSSLLNFVSSHVSLMVLTIMSVAQWRTIAQIGGLRNVKKQVIVACVGSWLVISGVGVFYLLYTYAAWE